MKNGVTYLTRKVKKFIKKKYISEGGKKNK